MLCRISSYSVILWGINSLGIYFHTLKMRAGIGVYLFMWIMDSASGRWPSREPTKNNLDTTRIHENNCTSMRKQQTLSKGVAPGCCYDGGVETSIAGQSHSDGDGPAHHTQSVICKCLKSETHTEWSCIFSLHPSYLALSLIFPFFCSSFTHHCHCITGQYSTDIQNSIVGHIREDVDGRNNGHRDGDGQRQVSEII